MADIVIWLLSWLVNIDWHATVICSHFICNRCEYFSVACIPHDDLQHFSKIYLFLKWTKQCLLIKENSGLKIFQQIVYCWWKKSEYGNWYVDLLNIHFTHSIYVMMNGKTLVRFTARQNKGWYALWRTLWIQLCLSGLLAK